MNRKAVALLAALVGTSAVYASGYAPAPLTLLSTPTKLSLAEDAAAVAVINTNNGLGSGVLISKNRLITAKHVVDDAGGKILVRFKDGQRFTAKVVKMSEPEDLAVIELSEPVNGITPVQIETSKQGITQERYYGIGYPHALDQIVREGIHAGDVSMPGTKFNDVDGANTAPAPFDFRFYTMYDMPLLPGNSGGGIFDSDGNLVGVVSRIINIPNGGGRFDLSIIITGEAIGNFLAHVDDDTQTKSRVKISAHPDVL